MVTNISDLAAMFLFHFDLLNIPCLTVIFLFKKYLQVIYKFPNCLLGISTKQVELLPWRSGPDSLTYLQDCTIFFIQLTRCSHCMLNPPCHKVAHWDSTFCYSVKPFEANIDRMMFSCLALLSRARVPTV